MIDAQNRIPVSELQKKVEKIDQEVHKVIRGQETMLELLLVAIVAGGHVLIEGVPGVAKTLTTKLLAKTLSVDFSRVQFTPDLMPADVLGGAFFNLKTSSFEFRPGPIFSNIVLIDEVNRAPAKTQSALFEVMEEQQITSDGITHKLPPPFLVFATQNPIEHEGTYRLPEAQLDRFLFHIEVGYPSLEHEIAMLEGVQAGGRHDITHVLPVLSGAEIIDCQKTAAAVHVAQPLLRYIAEVANVSRTHPDLTLGASPRASIAMLMGGKALAAIRGRDFLTPDDLKTVAYPALRHRLILSPEKELQGGTVNQVIDDILARVEVPR